MASNSLVQASAPLAWQEPLDAFLRLRAAGEQPLLLDGMGAHPEARHACVAFGPVVEVRIKDGTVTQAWRDGAIEVAAEEPLPFLRRLADGMRSGVREPYPFTGGLVGLFGFGFSRAVEPTLPLGPATVAPDAVLRLCLDAVAFDRQARTAHLFCADRDGDVEAARARLAGLLPLLSGPVPAVPEPRGAGAWTASMGPPAFEAAVREAKRLIHHGDLFQANLATRFSAPCGDDPAALFARLASANPSPFMALLPLGDFTVVSGSPEQLFAVQGDAIRTRPIAGTRKRGATPAQDAAMEQELLEDAKEQAEHTMLVDLLRNDLARVCRPGTVRVAEQGSVERYRHVMHLASRVEGVLREGTGFADWLAALFPGGTVTGAPKVRACQRILELEAAPREAYTGSAGYLSWSHNAQWNILIRGLLLRDGMAHVHAGSGIVAGSDPEREWKEAGRKARALLEAATAGMAGAPEPGPGPGRLGEVTQHGRWDPPAATPRHAGRRVLLIDNYDSFVHNLADYCAALGAEVRVLRNDGDWRAAASAFRPTHVLLSPGPGWPEAAGCTVEVARHMHARLPLLGVCLGHQAIGDAFGARVEVHPAGPVHGRSDLVHHEGGGLLAGLPSPLSAARYHSLVVAAPPDGWAVDARLADGTVMAIRHQRHPTFGLQFHPESVGTPHGMAILQRWLGR